ncbi:hypothetical protein [Paenibacillus sambharensis]|nr:hypothetical protein [Paenibacillus sambharensis]
MNHPNETGQLQYERFTPPSRLRRWVRKWRMRYRDWDASRWYRKYGGGA